MTSIRLDAYKHEGRHGQMGTDSMGPPSYHGGVENTCLACMSLVLPHWHPPILPFQQGRLEW